MKGSAFQNGVAKREKFFNKRSHKSKVLRAKEVKEKKLTTKELLVEIKFEIQNFLWRLSLVIH